MNDEEYVLLVGADLATRERAIVSTARALRKPIVLLAYPGHPFAQTRRAAFALADDVIVGPYLLNPDAALEAVQEFHQRSGRRLHAIVPVNDFVLPACAAIARTYGLPFLDEAVILRCRDKLVMKRALADAGLNVARTVASGEDVDRFVWCGNHRLIFKPTTFGGSGGVKLVSNRAELDVAIKEARDILARYCAILHIDPTRLHLEEYLDAEREVSVEVSCTPSAARAIAVTDKQLSPPPFFAEIGHIVPYAGDDSDALKRQAERACRALGIDRGVAHVELRIVSGKPFVVEVGARPAGGKIVDLVHKALGIDLYALHAHAYANDFDFELTEPRQRGVAAISFLKAPPGVIKTIRTPSVPSGVCEIALYKGVGDITAAHASNFETREGHVEWFWPAGLDRVSLLDQTNTLAMEIFEVVAD
ncbi:acetyl-CoA carboxylase biotin carboxylase subunit family protein [Pandoraea sp. SD6-2]|uniref:ATP-grasp domain-containing protein n=1 Tax=Pandoraea sp. SD6-2 TaxID=1286093 RepID=UPI0003306526|nr:ATP-grasp domain-containing protein [Pandoraea sp. SD6-2]EON12904.1 hypothetical protein C266_14312 [Pandoraea sp. SD6-2]